MRQLSLGARETAEILPAISQLEEMGAYEHLWLNYPGEKAATTKKIIELFASKPGSIPSDFVSAIDAAACAKKVFSAIGSDGISEIGIRIRGISDYPNWLEGVRHQLPLLYFKGFWDLIWKPKRIAIVGTRSPSDVGIKRTRKLAELLIKNDFTIVSGLAKGIDTVAHTTAVSLGSQTVAVIGTPINEVYPKENSLLQRKIASTGLVISHVPFLFYMMRDWRWNRMFFPDRNITMSALTDATVIVEAGETSGTLIQAKAALKQGRKLFILASNFDKPSITWPERFLSKGAIKVNNIEDILEALDHGQHSEN